MTMEPAPLLGVWVITPKLFTDERGYFFESFNQQNLEKSGILTKFVQDNESLSRFGVLRGLHFQTGEWAQSKLVRVVKGKVWDVVVDLREGSATQGQHFSIELSGENKKQLLIPKGFAHGFVTLSEEAILQYKCDQFYHAPAERGLIFNDPTLSIDWQLKETQLIVNQRDRSFMSWTEWRGQVGNRGGENE